MDGTVEKTEHNAEEGVISGASTVGFYSGHMGEMPDVGGAGVFAYRLVHTQESVRLLDLRLDFASGINVVSLGRLLRAFERLIVEQAVRGEYERALQGSTGGLI